MNNGTNKRVYRQAICQNKCGNFIRNSTRYLEGWTGRNIPNMRFMKRLQTDINDSEDKEI